MTDDDLQLCYEVSHGFGPSTALTKEEVVRLQGLFGIAQDGINGPEFRKHYGECSRMGRGFRYRVLMRDD